MLCLFLYEVINSFLTKPEQIKFSLVVFLVAVLKITALFVTKKLNFYQVTRSIGKNKKNAVIFVLVFYL